MKARKTFRILLALFLALLSNLGFGQILKNVEFKAEDYKISSIAHNVKLYNYVSLKDAGHQPILGDPDLPVFYYTFYVPINEKAVSVTLKSKKQEIILLHDDLMPSQRPIPTSLKDQDTTFSIPNKLVYESDKAYPAMQARICKTDYLDGDLKLVTIEVYPMQYYPKSKKIIYSSQFEIKLETKTDDNSDAQKFHPKKRNRDIMGILKSMVVNPELASADSSSIAIKPTASSSKTMAQVGASTSTTLPYYEYVIITDASLVSGFTDFVNWKKRKGINIGVVTTNDIYSNYTADNISSPPISDNPGKVRQYLHDAHANGSTIWALIAGDYNTNVPVRNTNYSGETIPTDSYFSDLSGNWSNNNPLNTPDIFVGRLICSNTTEIQNWVNKVLQYEQNPGNGDYSYLLKAFSIEADQMQQQSQAHNVASYLPNFNHSYISEFPTPDATYNTDGLIITPSGYPGQYGTSKGANVITAMNNHYGLYSWFCHGGSGFGWNNQCSPNGQSGISTMNNGISNGISWGIGAQDAHEYCMPNSMHETGNGLDNLTNNNYPSILYSISCDVTPYDITSANNNGGAMNCGEAFTKLLQTGGVAFLGNTRSGYVDFSYLVYESFATSINFDDFHSHLGVSEALSRFSNQVPAVNRTYLAYSHNLIGCPETEMWTALPTKFSNASITMNGSSVIVSTGGLNNCQICVMSASDNGSSYFQVEPLSSGKTFINVPTPYYVTITKHNYIPYMYSSDYYIQNENFTGISTINGIRIWAGSNVTTTKPIGPVIIQAGANLTINADGDTNLMGGFEVQTGAQFEVK